MYVLTPGGRCEERQGAEHLPRGSPHPQSGLRRWRQQGLQTAPFIPSTKQSRCAMHDSSAEPSERFVAGDCVRPAETLLRLRPGGGQGRARRAPDGAAGAEFGGLCRLTRRQPSHRLPGGARVPAAGVAAVAPARRAAEDAGLCALRHLFRRWELPCRIWCVIRHMGFLLLRQLSTQFRIRRHCALLAQASGASCTPGTCARGSASADLSTRVHCAAARWPARRACAILRPVRTLASSTSTIIRRRCGCALGRLLIHGASFIVTQPRAESILPQVGGGLLSEPQGAAIVNPTKTFSNLTTAVDNLTFSPDGQVKRPPPSQPLSTLFVMEQALQSYPMQLPQLDCSMTILASRCCGCI